MEMRGLRKQLRLIGVTTFGVIALVLLSAMNSTDVLTATELRIVDSRGNVRGRFSAMDIEKPFLEISDPEGRAQLLVEVESMSLSCGGGWIHTSSLQLGTGESGSRTTCSLSAGRSNAALELRSSEGRYGVDISAANGNARLAIEREPDSDATARTRGGAEIMVSRHEYRFAIHDGFGNGAFTTGSSNLGSLATLFSDDGSRARVSAGDYSTGFWASDPNTSMTVNMLASPRVKIGPD